MTVKHATSHHRLSISVAMVLVVLAIGLLPMRATGEEEVKEPEPQVSKGGNLEALFLSERRNRQLAESRLHALQIASSLRHWNEGITWAAWDVLKRTDPKMRHFEYGCLHTLYNWGHTTVASGAYIHNVAWSPDGKLIATSDQLHTIKIWDATTLKYVKSLTGHDDAVLDVSFDRDSRRMVSCDRRGVMKIWDVESGEVIRDLAGHKESINSVEFNRDGKRIVFVSGDGTVRIQDTETGDELRVFRGHFKGNRVRCATFSPDGQWVASGASFLRIWNAETGVERRSIRTAGNLVQAVAFSPKGDRVVTGHGTSAQIYVQLWDVESGEAVHSYSGFKRRVEAVAFAPDGRSFAAGGYADGLCICSAETGEEIKRLKLRDQFITSVAYAPSGNRLVAASPGAFRVWELDTPQTPITLQSTIGPSFGPSGKWIATTNGNDINLRDPTTGKVVKTLGGHTERVNNVAFSPDGHQVASASADGTVRVWETDTGTTLTINGDDEKMHSVSWSPKGNWLVSYGARRRLWNAKTGESVADLPGPRKVGSSRRTFAFSPDELSFVCSDPDGAIHIGDVRTAEKRVELDGGHKLTGLAWSPRGDVIAGTFSRQFAVGQVLKVWEAKTGKVLFVIEAQSHGWTPRAVFSPDGSRVMMAMNRNIRSWDAHTGKDRHDMYGHTSGVSMAAYFPDGQRIVSAGGDGGIKIWNAIVGEELLHLDTGETTFVTVNHDGTRLLSIVRHRTRNRRGMLEFSHSVKLWHADGWKGESAE